MELASGALGYLIAEDNLPRHLEIRQPLGDERTQVPLARFAPLATIPSVRLYGLQKGPGREQLGCPDTPHGIRDLGTMLDQDGHAFLDSAAVIANLGLVITSDTAIAHLAGTLGAETWLLLPFMPDWRWGLEGDRTPWYPTMRLFRQRRAGDWDEVLGRAARGVAEVVA